MRYSLDAKQWARVREYMRGFTTAEAEEQCNSLRSTLSYVADGPSGRLGRAQSLSRELFREAMKWCKDYPKETKQ